MGKRLVPILALLAIWMPAASYALGLGNITMNSALNQPLDAEIELLDVQRGDLENLVVQLGSQQDFDRVGADRNFFLTKIQFSVNEKADGTPFIGLSTRQTVTEPFLDFVVEARWPRGRVLREFTVLVDPPTLVEEAPAPVQQARVEETMVEETMSAPEPEPASRVSNEEFFRSAPIEERAELTPEPHEPGELVYGPVKYSDTLYGIANQMRPQGVSVNQMMVALVRQNPNAFYHQNINEMKAGYILRINDRDAIRALSASEATAEVRRQTDIWRARKDGTLMAQAEAPAAGSVSRDAAAAGSAEGGAATAENQASLKLVAPGSEGSASGTGGESVDQLREDLLLAAEALDANRQETEDLKGRLREMEEQLAAMQRLILLKDNEMAQLQQQMGGDTGAMEPMGETMPAEGMAEETAPAMADAMEGQETTDAMMDGMAEPAPETAPTPQPVAPAAPAPEPMAASLLDEVMAQVMDVVEDPMSIVEKPILLYGLLAIVLVLLLGMLIARRRSMQDGFEESILNVGGDRAAASGPASMAESSMVSDFAMSDMSDMSGIEADAADVDPISEADVYLAYGRHQQAEDIIREAMKTSPDRHELKVKMLEVYFAAKNREAFETQAQELHDALGDENDPLWARAVTMGHQLCPGNELFGGVSADTLKQELASGADASDEDLLDFDFDLDSTDLDSDDLGGVAAASDEDIFADIDALDTETPAAQETDDNSLDFDMGDSGLEEPAAEADTGDDLDSGLDFDLGDMSETAESPAEEEVPEADKSGLDFDVSSLDFDLDEENTESAPAETAEVESDAGLEFSLEDDSDTAPAEEALTEATDELDSGLDFDMGDEQVEASSEPETVDDLQLDESAAELSMDDGLDDLEGLSEDSGLDMELADLDLEETALESSTDDAEALNLDDLGEELESDAADLSLETDDLELPDLDEELGDELGDDLGDELSEDVFGEVDEVGTKLDLARAYVDMGDQDGARNILNEVMEEGSEEQKSQAQELLGKID